MTHLDSKIVQEMKDDIEDAIFADEYGECIDALAGLETDEDIINNCLGGDENE